MAIIPFVLPSIADLSRACFYFPPRLVFLLSPSYRAMKEGQTSVWEQSVPGIWRDPAPSPFNVCDFRFPVQCNLRGGHQEQEGGLRGSGVDARPGRLLRAFLTASRAPLLQRSTLSPRVDNGGVVRGRDE